MHTVASMETYISPQCITHPSAADTTIIVKEEEEHTRIIVKEEEAHTRIIVKEEEAHTRIIKSSIKSGRMERGHY